MILTNNGSDMTTTKERKPTIESIVKKAALESGLYIPREAELKKDLDQASLTMGVREARFLVDYYYTQQEDRKRAHNQVRSLLPNQEPHSIISWLAVNATIMEDVIRERLGVFAKTRAEGRWARSIVGIGPVLSAGLVAHIDITKCRTVSQLWRFAGYDPLQSWLGREGAEKLVKEVRQQFPTREIPDAAIDVLAERSRRNPENLRRLTLNDAGAITWASIEKVLAKRPWNASLKTLCWKIGESFVKVSNNPDDFYGHLYPERKVQEETRNQAGQYADQAAAKLEKFKIGRGTDAYKAYSTGFLPPAHIHSRAERWTVKLFLSHYHAVAYEVHYGTPAPKPYVFDHLGHQRFIPIPNWPMP